MKVLGGNFALSPEMNQCLFDKLDVTPPLRIATLF